MRQRVMDLSFRTRTFPSVMLHVTCLRRDGFQTAYEGARVVCEVLRRPKGLQAFRIRAMDDLRRVIRRNCRSELTSWSSRRATGSGPR